MIVYERGNSIKKAMGSIGLLLAIVCVFCCVCTPKPNSEDSSTSQSTTQFMPAKPKEITESEKENIAREAAQSYLPNRASRYGTYEGGEIASFSGSGDYYNASGTFWVSDKYGDLSRYIFDMTIRLYENSFGQVDSFTAKQVYPHAS